MAGLKSQVRNYRSIPNNTNAFWFLDPCLRINMIHCLGCCFTLFFNGYDGSLLNGLQSIDRWHEYFDNPSATTLGLMNSAGFLPGIVAGFCGDRLAQTFGKRLTLWIGTCIAIVGIILMSVSTTTGMFCGGRTILGFGTPLAVTWLVKEGRSTQARAVLVKYHANGKEDDELVDYEFREIVDAMKLEDLNKQTTYLAFFETPGNRHRLMILIVVGASLNWVGNGIISYYLSPILNGIGVTDTRSQLLILVGLNIWNLIWSTSAAINVDRIGRRPLWLTATSGQLVTMAVIMGLSAGYTKYDIKAAGTAVIPFLFLFYASYDIAYTPMSYGYPTEILTYSLRTKGLAIYIVTVAIAVSLNTWINPIALDALGWKYYAIYIVINAALLAIQYFKFPETKDRTIEEIATIFDGTHATAVVYGQGGGMERDVRSVREDPEAKSM
ncbi:hexose transporter protein [Colletotrichum karsti]|uniref:Hexose transporter protein n=1 Tax=Colletotrichum karsti TaxID=1095194 RepID=A0A9P6IB27_9PEZI|nr:hexose transporter protein [Colletotrichum karsti]KAF9875365.1 hexose transporter protein [Colletotrichum karsti]